MKLRQYKKLVFKTIKQANDDDLLVVRFDMNKIKPELLGKFMKIISTRVHNCVAIPIDANMDYLNTDMLIQIREKIDKEINSRR